METLLPGLLVVGGGLGAALRVAVLRAVADRGWRAGTAWVNVPASLVAGATAAVAAVGIGPGPAVVASAAVPPADLVALAALALVLGTCGGLSTYSSLALEVALALRRRDRRLLTVQFTGVVAGLAAALLGMALGTASVLLLRSL